MKNFPGIKLGNEAIASGADSARSTFMPKVEQEIKLSEIGGNKRKLPSWESPNKNLKTNDRDVDAEDEKRITNDKVKVATKTQISKSDCNECTSTSADHQTKGFLVHETKTPGKCDSGIDHKKNQSLKHTEMSQIASKLEDFTKPESSRTQKGRMPFVMGSQSDDALQQNVLTESKQMKLPFEKYLDGVIFALSGLVNPERANIREKALQMGAQYRPDWTSDCTLLVCAFANTPKFNQVMNDNGSIVSKDWILDCYQQKQLLEIDSYLMHAGKPWRKLGTSLGNDTNIAKNMKTVSDSASDKSMLAIASLPEVQRWVHADVGLSIAWLQHQEHQPKPDEIKWIAIQGINLCLEDTIKCLKNKQNMENIMNTWEFVPRAVRELALREETAKCTGEVNYFSDLLSEAERLKWIYSSELDKLKAGIDSKLNGDSKDRMSDGLSSETDSEATEILEEDDIAQAKEAIRKTLASESVM